MERPSADSFERHSSVGANYTDVDHPCGVFDEPSHNRVIHMDFSLDPSLKVQLVCADDACDLLHCGFNFAIGCVVVRIRMLLHDLFQLLNLEPRFCQSVLEQ